MQATFHERHRCGAKSLQIIVICRPRCAFHGAGRIHLPAAKNGHVVITTEVTRWWRERPSLTTPPGFAKRFVPSHGLFNLAGRAGMRAPGPRSPLRADGPAARA